MRSIDERKEYEYCQDIYYFKKVNDEITIKNHGQVIRKLKIDKDISKEQFITRCKRFLGDFS